MIIITIFRIWLSHCIFCEKLELESFPFDLQHFEMVYQFRPFESNINIKLSLNENLSNFEFFINRTNITGWNFIGIELPTKKYAHWDLWERGFNVILKRHWLFYFYRVFFVLFLIGLIVLSVFVFGDINSCFIYVYY